MNTIKTKAASMAGIKFDPAEKSRNLVRVQIKDVAGALKVRKWNYRTKKFGKWAPL